LVRRAIERSQVVHHWSGIGLYSDLEIAKQLSIPIIAGPNLIDRVNKKIEDWYLQSIRPDLILTPNEQLRWKIGKEVGLKTKTFIIGPDTGLWAPTHVPGQGNGKILWKGNSKHSVKDIGFALQIAKELPQYQFDFIGHPKPYDYQSHIARAKEYSLYFCTSYSETFSIATAEMWSCGITSVTHPLIHLHGKNYQTGIITNKNYPDYCNAITEIMENDALRSHLSLGALKYAQDNFDARAVAANYIDILREAYESHYSISTAT
jgi:glycosyltransferase involved in cell wall biosynthesis